MSTSSYQSKQQKYPVTNTTNNMNNNNNNNTYVPNMNNNNNNNNNNNMSNSNSNNSNASPATNNTGSVTFQQDGRRKTINYSAERVVGSGSFGVVFLAKVFETGEAVAIKKVLQDKRFKNRELQIMKMLSHVNVVEMKHCFYSNGDKVRTQTIAFITLKFWSLPATHLPISYHQERDWKVCHYFFRNIVFLSSH